MKVKGKLIVLVLLISYLLVGCEFSTSCEEVELSLSDNQFGNVPLYHGAIESKENVILSNTNDPMEHRCEMAYVFNEDFANGAEWKHFITSDNLDEACTTYSDRLNDASWLVSYEDCETEGKVLLSKKSGQHLLVLFPLDGEKTSILIGLQIE